MLISVKQISKSFRFLPNSILHIGAHTAEEFQDYEKNGWGKDGIIWVEAQKELCGQIKVREMTRDRVVNCLAWNKNGEELNFKLTNNSQSSSILNFGTHKSFYPDINFVGEIKLRSKRLDSVLDKNDIFDLINIDVQGVEKEALEGLGDLIQKANYIYSEVNKKSVYQNCTLIQDLDLFLKRFGFVRIATRWVQCAGWGDALYIKSPNLKIKVIGKFLNLKLFVISLSEYILTKLKEFINILRKI